MAPQVKNLPIVQEIQEMQVQSLGQEDPLEKEIVTDSSIHAWEILSIHTYLMEMRLREFK